MKRTFACLLLCTCRRVHATSEQGRYTLVNETERELPFAHSTRSSALKLYWEPGYTWQEETFDRRWCMRCRGNCTKDIRIELTPCDYGHAPTQFTFVEAFAILFNWMQIRVTGSDLCLQAVPDQDVVFLNGCNRWIINQWFFGSPESENDKFEMRPFSEPNQCLTQVHHPKDDEEIIIQDCDSARKDNTSYWIKY